MKQLQEFLKSLKSGSWLRRNCIMSAGIFYFEPPCSSVTERYVMSLAYGWQFW